MSSGRSEAQSEIINANGGDIKPTWGVPIAEIQRGIRHGVRKVNIDTDLRVAITSAVRETLWNNPEEFDPRKYLKPAMDSMKALCIEKFTAFGTDGQVQKIKSKSLSSMARHYASLRS